MPIRDRWRKVRGKPDSGDADGSVSEQLPSPPQSNGDAASPVSPTTASDPAKIKMPTSPFKPDDKPSPAGSLVSKTFSWATNSGAPRKAKKPPKPKPPPAQRQMVHPSERPLSETNMRHQELFSTFQMSFGRRKASNTSTGARSSFSNISPSASRSPSVASAAVAGGAGTGPGPGGADQPVGRRSTGNRLSSTLAHELRREETVEEGDEGAAADKEGVTAVKASGE